VSRDLPAALVVGLLAVGLLAVGLLAGVAD
jgi:hypothetical protein